VIFSTSFRPDFTGFSKHGPHYCAMWAMEVTEPDTRTLLSPSWVGAIRRLALLMAYSLGTSYRTSSVKDSDIAISGAA